MIFEYALDPEIVVRWAKGNECDLVGEGFGVGQPRFVSRFPKNWTRYVFQSLHNGTTMEKKQLEELLDILKEKMIVRLNANYEPNNDWLENVDVESERYDFHAIISTTNPKEKDNILTRRVFKSQFWKSRRASTPIRTGKELAFSIANILKYSSRIILIDPHFNPDELRYRQTLMEVFKVANEKKEIFGESKFELICKYDDSKPTEDLFKKSCRKKLKDIIGRYGKMTVRRYKEITGEERMHNRYVLTDLGGVIFGSGLDRDKDLYDSTDDLNLMDREQYAKRWRQYIGVNIAFEKPEKSFEIP